MESNGKSATRDGTPAHWQTGPVVWGEPGTNAQHAFFQLLHQGTRLVPVDFIVAARGASGLGGADDAAAAAQHRLLLANCLAQSAALMHGRDAQATRAALVAAGHSADDIERLLVHCSYAGNQPSTTLLLRCLDPRTLGSLIALYEHKIFCQGILWQVCSFDQWGVELGKALAQRTLPLLEADDLTGADAAVRGLIEQYRRWK